MTHPIEQLQFWHTLYTASDSTGTGSGTGVHVKYMFTTDKMV